METNEDHITETDIQEKYDYFDQLIKQKEMEELIYFQNMALNRSKESEFDVEEIYNVSSGGVWDPSVIWFGTRRTGKSVSVKDIVEGAHQRGLIGRITVITGTKQNRFWHTNVPYASIFPLKMAREVIQSLIKQQEQRKLLIDSGKQLKFGEQSYQHTLILDDFIHDKSFARYSDELSQAFVAFRHIGCAVLITAQHPTGVSPMIRGNADFIFVTRISGRDNIETIRKDHLTFLPRLSQAAFFMETITRDYVSVVIHKTDPSATVMEKVKWYKATDMDADGKLMTEWGNYAWRRYMEKEDQKAIAKETNNAQQDLNLDEVMGLLESTLIMNEIEKIRNAIGKHF
jgi:hypothetical protein